MDTFSDKTQVEIDQLPVDNQPTTETEKNIINNLFLNGNGIAKIFSRFKEVIIATILFILLSIPQIENLIMRFFPSTEKSAFGLIMFKSLAFMVIFLILTHWSLTKK